VEPEALLDTDTLSAILRMDPNVIVRAQEYVREHIQLNISIITRFEILRGLKARDARSRLRNFENFCETHSVLELSDDIVVKASDVYADLSRRGELIGDMDTLIAATALTYGYTLITNNARHYSRVQGLQIDNWVR
jgi:tRNA(fMet)-specific endonuclease VapC